MPTRARSRGAVRRPFGRAPHMLPNRRCPSGCRRFFVVCPSVSLRARACGARELVVRMGAAHRACSTARDVVNCLSISNSLKPKVDGLHNINLSQFIPIEFYRALAERHCDLFDDEVSGEFQVVLPGSSLSDVSHHLLEDLSRDPHPSDPCSP